MRIVVYQDFLRVGGTESQSLSIARRFTEQGHQVSVLTNRPGGPLRALATEFGIEVQTLQPFDFRLNWAAPGLVARLRQLRPDIVLLMGRNANGVGRRLQLELQDTLVVSSVRTGRPFPRAYRESLKAAQLVCCNSQFAARRTLELGVASDRIAVHPNPCLRATGIDAQIPRHLQDRPPCARLIYVAAFVRGKNHESLIRHLPDLLGRLPFLQLTLVGEGPLLRPVQQLVRRLKLDSSVAFLGYRTDIPELLAQSDLAVSPSLEESMPNALVEAQYAGLPVVAFDVAGVGECLLHEETGLLVSPGDFEQFGLAVHRILRDPSTWREMAAAAHAFAHQEFDPDLRFDAFHKCVIKYASAQSA